MKKCKICEVEKEESEFFKKRDIGLEGSCKQCRKNKLKERISLNPEFYREKERVRAVNRRKTEDWKNWRKDHQNRNREKISKEATEKYNKDKNILEKQKIWRSNNGDKLKLYNKKNREKFPLKAAARSFLNAAIKGNILKRPENCSICFKECKAEAHHEDYLKPLEVIWVCRSCHGKKHRKIKYGFI